jgi:hypothetical protein
VVRVDERNEADRILGEDWMDPRHALLVKALEAHPERGLIRNCDRRRRSTASAAGRSAANSNTSTLVFT